MNTTHHMSYKLSLIASLAGLLYGFDSAVIAGAISHLSKYFSLDAIGTGWAVSSVVLGFMIGALSGQFINNALGRKKALLISGLLVFLAGIFTAFPYNFTLFILFRILGGVGVGLGSATAPVYIGEISAPEIRGKTLGFYQMMIAFGILLVYLVNALVAAQAPDQAWATQYSWRFMLGAMALPGCLFMVLVCFLPESPRWLMGKNRDAEANKIMKYINGEGYDCTAELSEIKRSFADCGAGNSGATTSLLSKKYRRVSFTIFAMALLANLCGINAVLYYGNVLLENIGIANERTAYYQQIIIGIAFFAAAVWAVYRVDKYGRRKLLVVGSFVCFVSLTLLGILIWMGVTSIFMLVIMIIYILFFGGTVGPILWIIIPELSPNIIRGKLMSWATFLIWSGSFIVSQTFPMLTDSRVLNEWFNGSFPFLLYGLCCLLWFLLNLFCVTETKDKSLEQISAEMSSA
ncbi:MULTISPECIES: sugar porter family MFS transporter [Raoultella]|uniref:sugar porter family MFS transporter n=1 Tax=Raoultella TaxID=160674 RepID=UPI002167346B|nr:MULTISPECIES: sugar porter family MFS transporter [Raoultella]MCS4270361.1 SP family arabinose:H+ symporter-like MFS transporter/SP family xylose:H+ symportor-like MFS transporter [Raoultella sp. BIGb0132]MCS4287321.1 SP family arabinose:H+ symporter-like MFS transporter/SP family xylose:H+ symportor-like MFS transporter [Raoultella terrigena]